MMKKLNKARKFAAALARADMVFYLLPPLMLLLTAGTIAQRPMGLFAAQKMFFGSFYFWAGPIPLPGGYLLLGILSFSLLIKFLLHSEWSWRKAGINLTHLGVIALLLGGLLTAMLARESYMLIPEGQQSPYLYDYNDRVLYIFGNDILEQAISFERLNQPVKHLPFDLKILGTCTNCDITKRSNESGYKDMARFMELSPMKSAKEPEENIPGLTFSISGTDKKYDGTYIAFEGMPKPVTLKTKDKEYKIIFGKRQTPLSFSIRLDDFVREAYPGTDTARAYHSDITILDHGLEWPARIEMNKPLRYKGYTFYQSSFEQSDNMQATILSVVENKGRIFPYLGTFIMAAGLLLHLFIIMRERNSA